MTTEQTWQTFSEALRAYFRRRVRDDALADDLLQEAFLRIHRGLAGVDQPRRLSAWVYRVARNVLVDHFRARHPSPAPLADDPAAEEDEDDPAPRELAACVAQMVQQLPATYRDAVTLAELNGLPQREVAERLGLSLSGAKSRIQRGRARLRQMLLRCCRVAFDRRGNAMDYQAREAKGCRCAGMTNDELRMTKQ